MHVIESGNVAAANGVKLARAQVVAAYPITPQTPLTEKLSEFVDSGEMDAQYIPVESEHSALSVCIAASSTGARAFTATSANGLLYMNEQLHWAAGARLPIVMCVVNRGIGAPWTVWNDHQDAVSQRDTGWIQLYACDHQQIIDNVIQAYAIAETVSIPVMVCYDGYVLSHTYMPFNIPDSAEVDEFLPAFSPQYALNPSHPCNLNTVTLPDIRPDVRGDTAPGYMEIRQNLHDDLRESLNVIKKVDEDFYSVFGRGGHHCLEPYKCEDADYIGVCMGSLSFHLRDVADSLREQGIKIGVCGLRVYRPFPDEEIRRAFKSAKAVVVLEKALSYGYQGALSADIKAALYHMEDRPFIHHFVTGLGGREIKTRQLIEALYQVCTSSRKPEEGPKWIGIKLEN